MNARIIAALSILIVLLLAPLATAQTTLTLEELATRVAALETRVTVLEGTPVPPPSTTPTTAPAPATATPTPIPSVSGGWHPAGSHDGLNVHEHGDAPPGWVLTSANPPFSQSRESHTGYKGVLATSPGGVASYLIAHILSTVAARSHGDHDYEMWLRDPEAAEVSYVSGILDFGNPPPLRTADTGERPIILSVGDAGCETWYSRPGNPPAPDIGWTICGRYAAFDGEVRGGRGTFRGVDWIIPCRRLPAGPLVDNCRTEFGVSRLSFVVTGRELDPARLARPIN